MRDLICSALAEHEQVRVCKPAATMYVDRVSFVIVDDALREWTGYIMSEPRAHQRTAIATARPPRRGS